MATLLPRVQRQAAPRAWTGCGLRQKGLDRITPYFGKVTISLVDCFLYLVLNGLLTTRCRSWLEFVVSRLRGRAGFFSKCEPLEACSEHAGPCSVASLNRGTGRTRSGQEASGEKQCAFSAG